MKDTCTSLCITNTPVTRDERHVTTNHCVTNVLGNSGDCRSSIYRIVNCPWYSGCKLNFGFPRCVCPQEKCPTKYEPVCGDDRRTYSNTCHMRKSSCRKREQVKVETTGHCREYNVIFPLIKLAIVVVEKLGNTIVMFFFCRTRSLQFPHMLLWCHLPREREHPCVFL